MGVKYTKRPNFKVWLHCMFMLFAFQMFLLIFLNTILQTVNGMHEGAGGTTIFYTMCILVVLVTSGVVLCSLDISVEQNPDKQFFVTKSFFISRFRICQFRFDDVKSIYYKIQSEPCDIGEDWQLYLELSDGNTKRLNHLWVWFFFDFGKNDVLCFYKMFRHEYRI